MSNNFEYFSQSIYCVVGRFVVFPWRCPLWVLFLSSACPKSVSIVVFVVLLHAIVDYSTDAVFPAEIDQAKENSDMTQYGDKLTDGYSQTKWVAEQLILKASQRGLPVAVYRCGNISGDSRSAAWNKQDFVLSVLQGRIVSILFYILVSSNSTRC